MKIEIEVADEQQGEAIMEALAERNRQDAMWGEQNHHPAYWLAILGKQVGQMGTAVLNREWADDQQTALDAIVAEAVQCTAVSLAIIEAIYHGNVPGTLVTSKPSDPRVLARVLNRGDESLNYDDHDLPEPANHVLCDCHQRGHTGDYHEEAHSIGEPGSEPCS